MTLPAQSPSAVSLVSREQAPLLARRFYGATPPSPITASLALVPELLEVTLPFVGRALSASALDARTKEIAVLRTSALLECRYCVQTHSVVALDSGLSRGEVLALRGRAAVSAAFSRRERVLLAWVDEVALGGAVEAAVRTALREELGEPGLVELTLVVAATLMLNRYCTALELPTSPDVLARLAALELT
jgi:AhpD family alkylhydroperoxidase